MYRVYSSTCKQGGSLVVYSNIGELKCELKLADHDSLCTVGIIIVNMKDQRKQVQINHY